MQADTNTITHKLEIPIMKFEMKAWLYFLFNCFPTLSSCVCVCARARAETMEYLQTENCELLRLVQRFKQGY
jgi:hypothetical protein